MCDPTSICATTCTCTDPCALAAVTLAIRKASVWSVIVRCPTEESWLVVGEAFEMPTPAFRWNEFDRMAIKSAEGDAEWTTRVANFWSHHVPVAMDVESDYHVWLLRLPDGAIVHTFAPEWKYGGTVVAAARAILRESR